MGGLFRVAKLVKVAMNRIGVDSHRRGLHTLNKPLREEMGISTG